MLLPTAQRLLVLARSGILRASINRRCAKCQGNATFEKRLKKPPSGEAKSQKRRDRPNRTRHTQRSTYHHGKLQQQQHHQLIPHPQPLQPPNPSRRRRRRRASTPLPRPRRPGPPHRTRRRDPLLLHPNPLRGRAPPLLRLRGPVPDLQPHPRRRPHALGPVPAVQPGRARGRERPHRVRLRDAAARAVGVCGRDGAQWTRGGEEGVHAVLSEAVVVG